MRPPFVSRPHPLAVCRRSFSRRLALFAPIATVPLLLLCAAAGALGAASRAHVVGVVVDGPWWRNAEVHAMFEREIRDLTRGEFDVALPESKWIAADWSKAGITAALERLLQDPDVDIVIALGVVSSDVACRRATLPKPTIATAVLDAELQGFPRDRDTGASGTRNLTYLQIPSRIQRDLETLREISPCERIAIVLNRYIAEELPSLVQPMKGLRVEGIEPVVCNAGSSAQEALDAIPPDADAVYLAPLFNFSESALDSLVAGINARKLPSFSSMGEREVRRGVLATITPDLMPKMARRLAVTVHRILRGEELSEIPTAFTVGDRLVVNIETAQAIGIYPTWAVLAEADLVGEEQREGTIELTIESAVREALEANRTLAAEEHIVAAGAQEVKSARSVLLPQADLFATGVVIDEDRAEAGLGAQPERTLTGSATVSQVVFSEPALANLSIEKKRQLARESAYGETELDVALDAATAYIDVLRARALERIQKETLRLSRDHLDVARGREEVGSAGSADVYRWESQLATDRKDAIDANAARNLAEMELARVLHRPLETPFSLAEAGLEDRELTSGFAPALDYFNDKISFRALREFLVAEGLGRSPEIAQLDAAIAAADRAHASAGRAFWMPELALQGAIDRQLEASGAGSEPPPIGGLFGEPADETDWSVALQASYPLFRGGERFAQERKAREDAARFREERSAAAEAIEQRIRSALHNAGASYAGIREAATAAEAARKNLDLVGDAYSRGAISLIDLLDAQNAYTIAEQTAATATHEFLLDLVETQRALGRFDLLTTPEERAAFRARLEAFMSERGIRAGGDR